MARGGVCVGEEVSVQEGGLCPGGSVRETPCMVKSGGMHPSGMHSCFAELFLVYHSTSQN